MSFFEKLKNGLSKTRENFTERIEELIGGSVALDEDFMEELEMLLIAGDVGMLIKREAMLVLTVYVLTSHIFLL